MKCWTQVGQSEVIMFVHAAADVVSPRLIFVARWLILVRGETGSFGYWVVAIGSQANTIGSWEA
jgi:hypothetical protein